MFDVSLSEMMVIAVVALIVIGPEKLPKVARTLGLLAGRLQRYVSGVKADISRELQLDELRKLQQDVRQNVEQAQQSFYVQAHEIGNNLGEALASPEKESPQSPETASAVELTETSLPAATASPKALQSQEAPPATETPSSEVATIAPPAAQASLPFDSVSNLPHAPNELHADKQPVTPIRDISVHSEKP